MSTPNLSSFTDVEIAVGLRRLGVARLKLILPLVWAALEADAKAALIAALRASPDFAGAVAAQAAGAAAKAFVANLLTPGGTTPPSSAPKR